jgi:hypothetical protein
MDHARVACNSQKEDPKAFSYLAYGFDPPKQAENLQRVSTAAGI